MNHVALSPVEPTPDEVQYLEDRIYEFNSSTTGIVDGQWLAFFVREEKDIVAGICSSTWGGTCEVRQRWVEPSQRARGLGTKLLQAPAFYERHGFEVLAMVDDHPQGHHNLLMRKRLAAEQQRTA